MSHNRDGALAFHDFEATVRRDIGGSKLCRGKTCSLDELAVNDELAIVPLSSIRDLGVVERKPSEHFRNQSEGDGFSVYLWTGPFGLGGKITTGRCAYVSKTTDMLLEASGLSARVQMPK